MIRARALDAGRAGGRPTRVLTLLLAIAAAGAVTACTTVSSSAPARTTVPNESTVPSGVPGGSGGPSTSAPGSPAPTARPRETGTPAATDAPPDACSGSDANREFFRQAAASMSWSVYCAVLPDGWFLESGSYRLADGGRLEVTYRGPGDAHLAIAEGHACAGVDVEACAPRDALVGPAPFGDRDGELGRLANGLVLDLDRGGAPSWRVTGLGLTEEAFREVCAALIVVGG